MCRRRHYECNLSCLIKKLDPNLNIVILERLDSVAKESSATWNNAGTGHSALCELNYTPEDKNNAIITGRGILIFGIKLYIRR